MKLTAKRCEAAKREIDGSKIYDGGGLYLELHKNGAKYWRYKYRVLGKEKVLALGVSRYAERQSPAFLNAIRQNLGHKSIDTTLNSYGQLSLAEQRGIISENSGLFE